MASSPQTVLSLLNTLYASGFAIASPSTPLLKGRIMHTLYALTFLIMSFSSLCTWIHVSLTIRTSVTSFPLKSWIIIGIVVVAVIASILCSLLLMLCIENAFAERLHIAPYRSGFGVVVEAFSEWIQAFNCFRVGFLFMLLHDAPISLINFFLIAACRCSGPHVAPWSLLLSAFALTISLIWRLVLLYFSYRRMLCYRNSARLPPSHVYLTPYEHFVLAIDISDGGRPSEYDECWPIRYSRIAVENNLYYIPYFMQKIVIALMSIVLFIGSLLICCIPCIHYYTCKKNSLMRRHKFSRSLVRNCSYFYHHFILLFSVCSTLSLIGLNTILLSSVHVVGSNSIPPEIDQLCITVDTSRHSVHFSLASSPVFRTLPPPNFIANRYEYMQFSRRENSYGFSEEQTRNNSLSVRECKLLWDNAGLGMGLKRKEADMWQARFTLKHHAWLAVATRVRFHNETMRIEFELAVIQNKDGRGYCKDSETDKWNAYTDETHSYRFPYFWACDARLEFVHTTLLFCQNYA